MCKTTTTTTNVHTHTKQLLRFALKGQIEVASEQEVVVFFIPIKSEQTMSRSDTHGRIEKDEINVPIALSAFRDGTRAHAGKRRF